MFLADVELHGFYIAYYSTIPLYTICWENYILTRSWGTVTLRAADMIHSIKWIDCYIQHDVENKIGIIIFCIYMGCRSIYTYVYSITILCSNIFSCLTEFQQHCGCYNSLMYMFSLTVIIFLLQVNEKFFELKGTYRDCRKSTGNKLRYWYA